MSSRIFGFDLARAYAVFGMFIVNYHAVFGDLRSTRGLDGFLQLFNGNASTLFVILSGMGTALMVRRGAASEEERLALRQRVMRRSYFLFAIGLLLYSWWPPDILHMYGAYLHIAALMLFLHRRWYAWSAVAAVVVFHVLLFFIPYEAGWDFSTLRYTDFWTPAGFLRNTLYNGWNPFFPWMSFFLLGMWLGRLDWTKRGTAAWILVISAAVWSGVEALRRWAIGAAHFPEDLRFYLTADYLPPTLPFMLGTASAGCAMLVVCVWIGQKLEGTRAGIALSAVGQSSLSLYVLSLTLGMLGLATLTGRHYGDPLGSSEPVSAGIILAYAVLAYTVSIAASVWWMRRWRRGPLEWMMRRIAG